MHIAKATLVAAASIGLFAATAGDAAAETVNVRRLYTIRPNYYEGWIEDANIANGGYQENQNIIGAYKQSDAAIRNISGSGQIVVDYGTTLLLNSDNSSTFTGTFQGEGNIVKNGSGSLQYGGFGGAVLNGNSNGGDDGYFLNQTGFLGNSLIPYYVPPDTPLFYPGYYAYAMNTFEPFVYNYNPLFPNAEQLLEVFRYHISNHTPTTPHLYTIAEYGLQQTMGNELGAAYMLQTNMPALGSNFSYRNAGYDYAGIASGGGSGFFVNDVPLQEFDENGKVVWQQTSYNSIKKAQEWLLYAQPKLQELGYTGLISDQDQFVNGVYSDYFGRQVYWVEDIESWGQWAHASQSSSLSSVGTVLYPALSGSVTINAGELVVSGYLGHWREFPTTLSVEGANLAEALWSMDDAMLGYIPDMVHGEDGEMVGVSNIILNGSGRLSFRNMAANIVGAAVVMGQTYAQDGPFVAATMLRLNFAHNLQTGTLVESKTVTITKPYWDEVSYLDYEMATTQVARDAAIASRPVFEFTETIDIYTNDQAQTELEVGTDDTYRVVVHMDAGWEGSVGVISGRGRFYKTGAGSFSLLNKAIFYGDVFVAGGQLILDPLPGASGTGDEILKTVASVNLVGDDGGRGEYMAPKLHGWFMPTPPINHYEYKPGYVPERETGVDAAQLVIPDKFDAVTGERVPNDQIIHNLQVLFAESAAPSTVDPTLQSTLDNAIRLFGYETYIAGTGDGTNIQINDNTLTIIQDSDGVYKGTINAGTPGLNIKENMRGTVVKQGDATLVFIPTGSDTKVRGYDVQAGDLTTNVQALAWSDVEIKEGARLTILQNTAGTMFANIISEDPRAELLFTTEKIITNGSGKDIVVGDGEAGTAQIETRQEHYNGTVIVENGVTVELNATSDDMGVPLKDGEICNTFPKTYRFELSGGRLNRETTLRVNNSDQRVSNLTGDQYARVDLRAGTLILEQDYDLRFDGKFAGQGGVIKSGESDFVLGGKSDAWTGPLIISEGRLILDAAASIEKASGVILKSGGALLVREGAQRIAALFGESGATIVLEETLTIGFSASRRSQIVTDNAQTNLYNMNYLATLSIDIKKPGDLNTGMEIELYGLLGEGIIPNAGTDAAWVLPLDVNSNQSIRERNGTTVGFLSSTLVNLNNAADLAYAGAFSGAGDVIVDAVQERVSLLGQSPLHTGAVSLVNGILRINADSFNPQVDTGDGGDTVPATAVIRLFPGYAGSDHINDTRNYLEVNVPAGEKQALIRNITGYGDVHKIGQGEATLAEVSYYGSTYVDRGRLVSTDIANLSQPRADLAGTQNAQVFTNNSGTLVLNSGTANYSFSGKITGNGGVEKLGIGSVSLGTGVNYGHTEKTALAKLAEVGNTGLTAASLKSFSAGTVESNGTLGTTAALPAGSSVVFNETGGVAAVRSVAAVRLPSGSMLVEGVINIPIRDEANPETIIGYDYFFSDNVESIIEKQDPLGVPYVEVKPKGLLVVKTDGSLVPLAADVVAAPAGWELRASGALVNPKDTTQRENTHGAVINAAGSGWTFYAPVSAGGTVVTGVDYFIDPQGWLLGSDGKTYALNDTLVYSAATGALTSVSNGSTVVLAGELVLANVPQYTDTAGKARQGEFEIGDAGTLTFNFAAGASGVIPTPATINPAILGAGTLQKDGAGKLTLGGNGVAGGDGTAGASVVIPLQTDNFIGAVNLLGGTLALVQDNVLAAASELIMSKDTLLTLAGSTEQSFHYLATNPTDTIKDAATAKIDTAGANVLFEVAANEKETRIFRGHITGGGALTKNGAGTLTLWRPAPSDEDGVALLPTAPDYDAQVEALQNQLDTITVHEGILRAAPIALGDALVRIDADPDYVQPDGTIGRHAELSFYTDAGDELQFYANDLQGSGLVSKSGTGTVRLIKGDGKTGTLLAISENIQFRVEGGKLADDGVTVLEWNRLIVDDTRLASEIPQSEVGTGGILQVNLTQQRNETIVVSQFRVQDIVSVDAEGNEVREHGTFAISARPNEDGSRPALLIAGTPLGYTGLTRLIGGLELQFDPTEFANSTAVLEGGISGEMLGNDAALLLGATTASAAPANAGQRAEDGSVIATAATAKPVLRLGGVNAANPSGVSLKELRVIQNFDAEFAGDIIGYANGRTAEYGSKLTIAGPGKLTYLGNDGHGILFVGDADRYDTITTRDPDTGELVAVTITLDIAGRGVGNVTVDSGRLQVGARNSHAIDVINGGYLYIASAYNEPSDEIRYAGLITNTTGDGDFSIESVATARANGTSPVIVWTPASFSNLTREMNSLGASEGTTRLEVGAGATNANLLESFHTNALTTAATLEIAVATGGNTTLYATTGGALNLTAAASKVTGAGALVKTGAGALGVEGVLGVTGPVEVREGKLHGNFKTTGDLVVDEGAVLAPGNSTGSVAVAGNLWLLPGGRLEIEVEGSAYDSVSVSGTAYLNGEIYIAELNREISRGTVFPFVTGPKSAAGTTNVQAVSVVFGDSLQLNTPPSNANYILIGNGIGTGTAYATLWANTVAASRTNDLRDIGAAILVTQRHIADVPGVKVATGLGGVLEVLDFVATLPIPPWRDSEGASNFDTWFSSNQTLFASLSRYSPAEARALFAAAINGGSDDPAIDAKVSGVRLDSLTATAPARGTAARAVYDWLKSAYSFGATINTTADAAVLSALVEGFSPVAYASIAGLSAATVTTANSQIFDRLEQRRYETAGFYQYDWQFYLAGTGTTAENGSNAKVPRFDYHTAGGVVGADRKIGGRAFVGAAVSYDNGRATLDGGGHDSMNSVRGSLYLGAILDERGRFFADGGLSVGYGSFDVKRGSYSAVTSASTNAWNAGAFGRAGILFALSPEFFVTPYVGLEYTHYDVSGFSESGSLGATGTGLRVDGFAHNSLRGSVGAGFTSLLGRDPRDPQVKLTLDIGFSAEILDADADLTSTFADDPFGMTRTKVSARVTQENSFWVAPSMVIPLSAQASVFAGYRWEYGFDGGEVHSVNAGVRFRF
ncbi:MAG: autotransporter domain-containing protein [Puniceicoccales bacterium]|jgi:uncharacterized protein YhjY with autotransporter beta-barrel domain|nr:autotransporter domain-containing protein [Puniceicoccales bacterium]